MNTNNYAYLVYLGNQGLNSSNPLFFDAFNKVQKTQIQGMDNAFFVWDSHDLSYWYGLFNGQTQGQVQGQTPSNLNNSTATPIQGSSNTPMQMPVIVPIDYKLIQSIPNLPTYFGSFFTQSQAA